MAVKQALILNIKFTELESVTMIDWRVLSSCAAPICEDQWSVLPPLQPSQYQELIDNTEVDAIQHMSIEDTDTEDEVLKVEAIIARYAREIAMVLRGIKKVGRIGFMNQEATD